MKRLRWDPEELCCVISGSLFEDPVVACDGFTYERKDIQQWVRDKPTSPKTREPLPKPVPCSNDWETGGKTPGFELLSWKKCCCWVITGPFESILTGGQGANTMALDTEVQLHENKIVKSIVSDFKHETVAEIALIAPFLLKIKAFEALKDLLNRAETLLRPDFNNDVRASSARKQLFKLLLLRMGMPWHAACDALFTDSGDMKDIITCFQDTEAASVAQDEAGMALGTFLQEIAPSEVQDLPCAMEESELCASLSELGDRKVGQILVRLQLLATAGFLSLTSDCRDWISELFSVSFLFSTDPSQISPHLRPGRILDSLDPACSETAVRVYASLIREIDVSELRYHDCSSSMEFSHGGHKGQRVEMLSYDLWYGRLQTADIKPLVAMKYKGAVWVICGNRRCRAMKTYVDWLGPRRSEPVPKARVILFPDLDTEQNPCDNKDLGITEPEQLHEFLIKFQILFFKGLISMMTSSQGIEILKREGMP